MCDKTSTIQGTPAMAASVNGGTIIMSTSSPRPWPANGSTDHWHLKDEPGGGKRIWISDAGRILWNAPSEEKPVTFKDIAYPDDAQGVEKVAKDMEQLRAGSDGNSTTDWNCNQMIYHLRTAIMTMTNGQSTPAQRNAPPIRHTTAMIRARRTMHPSGNPRPRR